ncbi:IS66 family insertion sequence element accessory protein TnpA [Fontivita pretiosa]|uniref:IS66 family insertion sequence element accessory protein TnpA n=1 Tax=Fontivita pretiosa TaxID=2989684 RepID=UPI003D16B1D6
MNQNTSVVAEPDQNQPGKPDAATRWRRLLEDQRASGLPVSVFCRQRGIPASSLFAWRRRLTGGAEVFKPVKLVGEPKRSRPADDDEDDVDADGAIEVCLAGQRRLIVRRGFDRELFLELIEALESRP